MPAKPINKFPTIALWVPRKMSSLTLNPYVDNAIIWCPAGWLVINNDKDNIETCLCWIWCVRALHRWATHVFLASKNPSTAPKTCSMAIHPLNLVRTCSSHCSICLAIPTMNRAKGPSFESQYVRYVKQSF